MERLLLEEFVAKYTRGGVNKAFSHVLPPHVSVDDVEQDVHLLLLQSLGRDYKQKIEAALNQNTGFIGSPEHLAVQTAFKQALGRVQSAFLQRRRRGRLQELPLDEDVASRTDTAQAQRLLDLTLDLNEALAKLSDREKEVWTLSLEGRTTRDIAGVTGINFRRVAEMRIKIIHKLAAVLRS